MFPLRLATYLDSALHINEKMIICLEYSVMVRELTVRVKQSFIDIINEESRFLCNYYPRS
jgi:hypothetical protein